MLGSGSYKSMLTFRVATLGTQLAKQGHTVSLIVPSADKYNNYTTDQNPQLDGVKVIQPWQFTTRSAMLNLIPYLFTSIFSLLRARPQIIYLYKPTPITIMGLIPKLLFRTPVILDMDDLGSAVMKVQGQSGLQVWLVDLCERLTIRYASSVVVASSYLEYRIKKVYPNKHIIIISNGVDIHDYPVVKQQPLRHAMYYFGFINRLNLVEATLRAMPLVLEALPDTKLYMLGGGSALEEAKQLVDDLGITNAVIFTGWIDMYAAAGYAQFGDLAICYQPDTETVRAASNMKVFQYMAMGMVPVVSDVGDLHSYVRDGKAGAVVMADSVTALADVCTTLLKDTARRRKLAGTAQELAKSDYSWRQLSAQLAAFLELQLSLSRKYTNEGDA
jgi:glycosyltransferase involved in cell wall biosynthesis